MNNDDIKTLANQLIEMCSLMTDWLADQPLCKLQSDEGNKGIVFPMRIEQSDILEYRSLS